MLGLTAYRQKTAQDTVPFYDPQVARPEGELLWMHAAEPDSGRAVTDLARRMRDARPGLTILLTRMPQTQFRAAAGTIVQDAPSDHPDNVKTFLDHWKPDAVLWLWGGLQPNLITAVADRGIYLCLANAGQDGFDRKRARWAPDMPRRILARFDTWIARSEAAVTRLTQLGCPAEAIQRVPPLQPLGHTLPAADSDLEMLRDALGARPVWFARAITMRELPVVLAAHRSAMRAAHRLLLVIEPATEADAAAMEEIALSDSWTIKRWSAGEPPDESCEVLFADMLGEAGIWYRLAPVAFLGSTLDPAGTACDPYEAAALGSAILYGPHVQAYPRSYAKLAAAGAARIVAEEQTLGNAVARLILPAQSARMAMSAWDVVTQGTLAADQIADVIETALDARQDAPS